MRNLHVLFMYFHYKQIGMLVVAVLAAMEPGYRGFNPVRDQFLQIPVFLKGELEKPNVTQSCACNWKGAWGEGILTNQTKFN